MATRKYTTLPYTEYDTTAYDSNRTTIDRIVLHSTAGTLQAAINTFSSPTAQTSAHYIIDNEGKIHAGLEEYNVAYHAGNYSMNQRSIGIEHVDEGADKRIHTDAQYAMSIKLVADICKFYSIPCDSTHIIPHSAVVATACPNGLDVNRIITGAKALLNGGVQPTPDTDRRPYWFDLMNKVIWNLPKEKITDEMVNTFVKEYPTQRARSGNWDKLCLKAGISGDSNAVTVDALFSKIQSLKVCEDSVVTEALRKQIATLQKEMSAKLAQAELDCQHRVDAVRKLTIQDAIKKLNEM